MNVWRRIKTWRAKSAFKEGATVTQFLAPDIRRDVEVVDSSEIEAGYIVAKVRTWNVLHVARGLIEMPSFSAPARHAIDSIWK